MDREDKLTMPLIALAWFAAALAIGILLWAP